MLSADSLLQAYMEKVIDRIISEFLILQSMEEF
jgi:hypothetical protein